MKVGYQGIPFVRLSPARQQEIKNRRKEQMHNAFICNQDDYQDIYGQMRDLSED